MLKWTVTRRLDESILLPNKTLNSTPVRRHGTPRHTKSKAARTRNKYPQPEDKENQCTSTPYPNVKVLSPLFILESPLKDVSNITPTNTPTTSLSRHRYAPYDTASATVRRPPLNIEHTPLSTVNATASTATLQRFNFVDSYYDNPRYLHNDDYTINSRVEQSVAFNVKPNVHPKEEVTIEKKTPHKKLKRKTSTIRRKTNKVLEKTLSPTYTRAEDPASDLSMFFDDFTQLCPESLRPPSPLPQLTPTPAPKFNEREIRTPKDKNIIEATSRTSLTTPMNAFHLTRQNAVRIKKQPLLIALTLPNVIPSPETPERYNAMLWKSLSDYATTSNSRGIRPTFGC